MHSPPIFFVHFFRWRSYHLPEQKSRSLGKELRLTGFESMQDAHVIDTDDCDGSENLGNGGSVFAESDLGVNSSMRMLNMRRGHCIR